MAAVSSNARIGLCQRFFARPHRRPNARMRFENARLRNLLARAEETAAQNAMLLREGDHRIKNSLQIVASLLQAQGRREAAGPTRDTLNAAAARIQSVARIHDALQVSHGQDSVDLGKVLEAMCGSLQSMAGDANAVTISVRAEPIQAPIALAQPIGLAVTELVVNALRHAFPGNRAGAIQVSAVQANGQIKIVVADDGAGLPVGFADSRGYGLKLVRAMAKQIGGALSIESKSGAQFTLTPPLSKLQAAA